MQRCVNTIKTTTNKKEVYKHILCLLITLFVLQFSAQAGASSADTTDVVTSDKGISELRAFHNMEIMHLLKEARFIKSEKGQPLTLLHFSDIHGDKEALNRIISDAELFKGLIDDMICTGDMTANSGGNIVEWWVPNVMTCIGNHDSATYSSDEGYKWTAVSMAEREAYYIAPFEENWGIIHEAGRSYYYKDYPIQGVRLIVLDAMLYNSNGNEVEAQTKWLDNVLESALDSNLHVIISIHAPHGGAIPVDCSFSKYGQSQMPEYSDCNTPQVVIDTVAKKIQEGLRFIGYLVGHTHQDGVWDAEGDRTQLMFCVACSAVEQKAQWVNADLFHSESEDAYNLVTVDTTNTLIKIIRGGGADIDNYMRTRKAICFNYSTGELIAEIN